MHTPSCRGFTAMLQCFCHSDSGNFDYYVWNVRELRLSYANEAPFLTDKKSKKCFVQEPPRKRRLLCILGLANGATACKTIHFAITRTHNNRFPTCAFLHFSTPSAIAHTNTSLFLSTNSDSHSLTVSLSNIIPTFPGTGSPSTRIV